MGIGSMGGPGAGGRGTDGGIAGGTDNGTDGFGTAGDTLDGGTDD